MRRLGVLVLGVCLSAGQATASDSINLIVTLHQADAIGEIIREHGGQVLAQVGEQPVFLVRLDHDHASELARDPRVVGVEREQVVSLDRYPDQQAQLEGGLEPGQSVMSLFSSYGWEEFYGTWVLKDYMDQEALHMIDADDVRDLTTGAGARIAFIDTGVDFDHPALRPWVDPGIDLLGTGSASEWSGLDQSVMSLFRHGVRQITNGASLDQSVMSLFWDSLGLYLDQSVMSLFGEDGGEDPATYPTMFGHGTLVAGLLHAVAPEAVLVPVRAFDIQGNSTLFLATAAVYAAVEQDVDVINMSFSIGEDSDAFRRALDFAWSHGVVLVASVGNENRYADDVYPAAYPHVIGVAATERKDDYLAPFSNYGNAVEVVAPGRGVVSTFPGSLYATASGTSFSAPLVSGAVALLMSVGDRADKAALKTVVTADSIDDDNPQFRGMLGRGRINLENALDREKAEALIRAATPAPTLLEKFPGW